MMQTLGSVSGKSDPLEVACGKILQEIKRVAMREGKKTGFCIGNTVKKISRDYFFTPIRNTPACVCGSIIVDCISVAKRLVDLLDGEVDYFFVDTEKKISQEMYGDNDVGNVERAVRECVKWTTILTYKGNDLTVEAIDCFLAQKVSSGIRGIGSRKVAIIGMGNIGFKLAQKLVERGANVHVVRRDINKLQIVVRALNDIKPVGTLASVEGQTDPIVAACDADILIGLTPGTGDILPAVVDVVRDDAILVDVGKGSFSRDALVCAQARGLTIYRASIAESFAGQVTMLLGMEENLFVSMGRGEIGGVPVVAGGLLARKGEVVVDSIHHPTQVYGLGDGCGDFIMDPTSDEQVKLDKVLQVIDDAQESTG
jgi:hypothetical protein